MLLTVVMAGPSTKQAAVLVLDHSGPYDVESLADFLGRRTVPGIEVMTDRTYARTVRLPHGPAAVTLDLGSEQVEARFVLTDARDLETGVQRCRQLLDLDTDSVTVDGFLGRDPILAASVRAHPGLRVPGHVDGFEVAVRAVVGQQISVAGARTIVGRLVTAYGEAFDGVAGLTHLFPTPGSLAAADPARLPMPRSRGRALVAVAEAVDAGEVVLDRGRDLAVVRRALLALPGIGPWTADYIALRALGDPDVFMGTDLGVRQGLAVMGLADRGPEIVAAWSPWRSYALMHVWKSLDERAP